MRSDSFADAADRGTEPMLATVGSAGAFYVLPGAGYLAEAGYLAGTG